MVDLILWTAVIGTALALVTWSTLVVLFLWSCFQWAKDQLLVARIAAAIRGGARE